MGLYDFEFSSPIVIPIVVMLWLCATLRLLRLLIKKLEIFVNVKTIHVPLTDAESVNYIDSGKLDMPLNNESQRKFIPCFDPSTMDSLGTMPAMTSVEVAAKIQLAQNASLIWRKSTFQKRKEVLKILLKYILDNQETICRVSARDSGKAMVDASFSEVMCTCEKIRWLLSEGEKWLRPENRSAGIVMFYKKARVEYVPVGVVGAIVPWNYPFHNIMNPITAAIMAGNAIVVKVSEHASWSAKYYGDIIRVVLQEAECPCDLVQLITGYAEAGQAIASGNINKLIFVGSTQIGRAVMRAAVDRLTPVVLELGGKDALVICEDANLNQVVHTALRAAYQSAGANCCGGERFIVHHRIYEKFVNKAYDIVSQMRQAKPLGRKQIDMGSICMPGLREKVHELVQDAVSRGAQVVIGGKIPEDIIGQYYPPTIVTGVTADMRIWNEEVFGPVMTIVKFGYDEEAIELVNSCPFGLGASVFSRDIKRARRIASELAVGMVSINDFASTYMCQSLPFGGIKESGFDRFAGVEGLRGMCYTKSITEDRFPSLMNTSMPPLLQYPVKKKAFEFLVGLIYMFYGIGLRHKLQGLITVINCSVFSEIKKKID